MSFFQQCALEVSKNLNISTGRKAADLIERNSEWQRVNSLIADVLKDSSVLYSKLVRLQTDFAGAERGQLEDISNKVRSISNELSSFSESFNSGEADMKSSETPLNFSAPPPVEPPGDTVESPSENSEDDFDVEAEISDEDKELESEFEDS